MKKQSLELKVNLTFHHNNNMENAQVRIHNRINKIVGTRRLETEKDELEVRLSDLDSEDDAYDEINDRIEEIETETQAAIIESISETADISSSNIDVKEYTLVQESDNIYTGVLKTEYNDMTQTFDVKVVWDHNTDKYTYEWELKYEQ